MKTFFENIKSLIALIKTRLLKKKKQAARMKVVHTNYGALYHNSIKLLRGGSTEVPYRPLYGRELKMLSRRLKQFRRVQWRGSRAQKELAAKKLEKEWKRILRNRLRVVRGEASRTSASGGKKTGL